MNYTIKYDQYPDIVVVHVTGNVRRPKDSINLQKLSQKLNQDKGHKYFIFDMTQANIIGDIVDTYHVGAAPQKMGMEITTHKVALVYSDNFEDQRFLENVVVNRGYKLRVFTDINQAVQWLTPNGTHPHSTDQNEITTTNESNNH